MKNHNTLISLANSVTKRMFGGLLAAGMMLAASSPALAGGNHIGSNIQVLPRTTPSGIPVSNGLLGDSNPYGVQFVPQNFMGGHGMLQTNDVLVSNYNNTTVQLCNTVSTQGLGTTIAHLARRTRVGVLQLHRDGSHGLHQRAGYPSARFNFCGHSAND